MNILYVVPYVPSPIRVRPYQLIRCLAERGHTLTVLTLWRDSEDLSAISHLEQPGIHVIAERITRTRSLVNCLAGLPTGDPLQSFYCWQPALAKRLVKLAGGMDVIHIEHMRGARFGTFAMQDPSLRAPILWDSVDNITHLFVQSAQYSRSRLVRWLSRFERRRSSRYEGRLAAQFDRVLVTSSRDREALLALLPAGALPRIDIVANGVDLAFFRPGPPEARDPARLVVSGKMSYHANVAMTLHLVEQVMPLIWRSHPEVRLTIAGQGPPASIRALANDPRITVTGYIPDIRPYLQQAAIAVAPLTYGAGIQNKVLEAMACGTPVVATATAVSALTAQPGRDYLLAESAPAFAAAVVALLENAALRLEIGRCGRAYVETHHNWNQAAALLEKIYMAENRRKHSRI